MLDYKESIQQMYETKTNLEMDLLMLNYQLSENREDLVRKKNNLKVRIRNAKKRKINMCSISLSVMDTTLLTILQDIQDIDDILSSK